MSNKNLIPPLPDSGNSPGIRFLILIVQRLQPLILLKLAEFGWIRKFEERRCKFD